MIILTRQINQTLTIDADTKVTLVGINGRQVRIGIAAPKDVRICRGEIVERSRRGSEHGQEDTR